MNKDELLNEIKELSKKETYSDKDYEDFQAKLVELSPMKLDEKEEKQLVNITLDMDIKQVKSQLEQIDAKNYEELIHVRGELLSLYDKKQKHAENQEKKMAARVLYLEELKKQKETLQIYKSDDSLQLPINKKLGLTIQMIAKTMEVFMQEKDIGEKAKKIVKETALGVSGAAAITLTTAAIMSIFGGVIGYGAIVAMGLPYIANTSTYIGLSSLVRNITSDTAFQQYRYLHSEEYQNMVKAFYESHQEEFDEIQALLKKKEALKDREEIMNLNEEIMKKYDLISSQTNTKGIHENLELQIVSLLQESKSIREKIKEEYEDESNNDRAYYVENNKKLMNLNMRLFVKENSIKEAIQAAGKRFGKSVEVILITKAILGAVAPEVFPLKQVSDIGLPILISAINCVLSIPTYENKMKNKDTEFEKEEDKEQMRRIEEILKYNPDLELGKALV